MTTCTLVAQLALVGVVVVAPWMFGGARASAQFWFIAAVGAALACGLVREIFRLNGATSLPTALLPLAGGIALGVLQLVPLDTATAARLSPKAVELRARLAPGGEAVDEAAGADVAPPGGEGLRPLSLYPAATRHDVALLVLAAGMLAAGALFFRSPKAAICLFAAIALNGGVMAFLELVARIKAGGEWRLAEVHSKNLFGPFINANNAGGFLNLCLAGALGLVVGVLGRDETTLSGRGEGYASWPRRAVQWVGSFADVSAIGLFALSVAGCIVAALLCTMSRGAGVALIGAAAVTAALLVYTRRDLWRLWVLGLVVVAGVALVGWVGRTNAVGARLATLTDPKALATARFPHWIDGLRAARDFWRSGSGLGTYRYVYAPYQQRCDRAVYYHAENDPLEALVDGGVVGLALMAALAGLVGAACWRLFRGDLGKTGLAVAVTGAFALASQAIHGCFDFGLYLPANLLLFSLLCGAICGWAANPTQGRPGLLVALPGGRWLTVVALAALLAGLGWSGLQIGRYAVCENALKAGEFPETLDHYPRTLQMPPRADLEAAVARLEAAIPFAPDDAEARYRLADLHIALYRVGMMEALRSDAASAAKYDAAQLWALTEIPCLHEGAHRLGPQVLWQKLKQTHTDGLVRAHLLPALRHAVAARNLCPLVREVHLTIAQLCVLVCDPATDDAHIRRAMYLAPGSPESLFLCGFLDLQAGRTERACQTWRHALTVASAETFSGLREIVRLAGSRLSAPEIVRRVLPDSPALLVRVARENYAAQGDAEARRAIAARLDQCLDGSGLPEDEQCYYRAQACALRERYPQAIENYRRAVEMRFQAPDASARGKATLWRYELAMLLQQQGKLAEALDEARWCKRLDPSNPQYEQLVEQINHLRVTTDLGP